MLTLRVGTTTAPVDMGCGYCGALLPAYQELRIIETMPIHRPHSKQEKVEEEFTTACGPCYEALKTAAMKHKIPIEWDIEIQAGTRAAVGMKLINE